MKIVAYFMKIFNGQIDPSATLRTDDVRILDNEVITSSAYNYVLTSTQVKDIYNNGAINFGPSTGSP